MLRSRIPAEMVEGLSKTRGWRTRRLQWTSSHPDLALLGARIISRYRQKNTQKYDLIRPRTTFSSPHVQVTGTIASARRNRHQFQVDEDHVAPSADPRHRGALRNLLSLFQLLRAVRRALLHFRGILRPCAAEFAYRFGHNCSEIEGKGQGRIP